MKTMMIVMLLGLALNAVADGPCDVPPDKILDHELMMHGLYEHHAIMAVLDVSLVLTNYQGSPELKPRLKRKLAIAKSAQRSLKESSKKLRGYLYACLERNKQ